MRKLIVILFTVVSLVFLCGYSSASVDMSYIKQPTSIIFFGDRYKREIDSISIKIIQLNRLGKTNNKYYSFLIDRFSQLYLKSTINIEDEAFISKLIDKIKSCKGNNVIDPQKNSDLGLASFSLQFYYKNVKFDPEKIGESLKQGYITNINIYKKGLTLLPCVDANSINKLSTISITLDKDTMKYIKDYYYLHLNK